MNLSILSSRFGRISSFFSGIPLPEASLLASFLFYWFPTDYDLPFFVYRADQSFIIISISYFYAFFTSVYFYFLSESSLHSSRGALASSCHFYICSGDKVDAMQSGETLCFGRLTWLPPESAESDSDMFNCLTQTFCTLTS